MENNSNIWLIADTHFGMKGDDQEWLDDYINYFENDVIPIMKKEVGENDILVHCGDVFDNRTSIGLNTITKVISLFEKFSTIFNDIRIVVGNHDMYRKSGTDITSIHMLRYIPNVKIYFEPIVEVISGKTCLFNPWIEDTEKQKKVLSDVDVNYIFGHLQIGGSKTSDRSGVHVKIQGGVNKSDFKSAQVYAGHIHIKQDSKNVHYVGNPYHKDRGDIDNDKGITILDVKSGKTRFIENTTSPRFVTESIYDILNYTVGDLKERWKNNRVDLHLSGCDSVKCNFDDLRSCLNGYCRKLDTICDNNDVEELKTTENVDFNSAKSSNDYLTEFIKQQDLENGFNKSIMNKLKEYRERL